MYALAAIRLNANDDVVIARHQLISGTLIEKECVAVQGLISAGHKMATRNIAEGEAVRRYGQIIGFASRPITAGQHVHVHNLSIGDFSRDYAFGKESVDTVPATEPAFFKAL